MEELVFEFKNKYKITNNKQSYLASYQLWAELQSTTKSTKRGFANGCSISSIYN